MCSLRAARAMKMGFENGAASRLSKPAVRYLYKYGTLAVPDRLRTILLEDKLYFPTARELNDPTESLPTYADPSLDELIDYLVGQYRVDHPHATAADLVMADVVIRKTSTTMGRDTVLREMRRLFDEEMEGRYGILSLSKCKDSLPMWAHYGGGHTGYCLEFRNERELVGYEVFYGDKIPLRFSPDKDLNQADFLFTKHPNWAPEKEVRVLVKPPGSHFFSPDLLVSLALGKDVTAENERSVVEWVRARRLPLNVFTMSFDRASGELTRKAIA